MTESGRLGWPVGRLSVSGSAERRRSWWIDQPREKGSGRAVCWVKKYLGDKPLRPEALHKRAWHPNRPPRYCPQPGGERGDRRHFGGQPGVVE